MRRRGLWRTFQIRTPAAALCGCFAVALAAQDISARLDAVVQPYVERRQFSGSALVARAWRPVFSKSYGCAECEWNVPNTPDTRFRLGSLTKQFTAACIFLLQEHGQLNVEDPVRKYVPRAPAAWDGITIYHVLTHTSGIPSFTGFPEYRQFERQPHTPEQLLNLFLDKPLEFPPGARWNYSNSGYVLLGYIIEKVSGRPYAQFLRDNILTPLGMSDTGYDSSAIVLPRRASGYTPIPAGLINAPYIDMTVPFAAGALYSTTLDLLKWEQGLFGGKLLTPESLQKMTTPFKNDYACGLFVRSEKGRRIIAHSGGIEGFNTTLAYWPDDQLVVAVLANLNGRAPDQLAAALAEAALKSE